MQDIVFYVAAKETLGKVRDYSNMRNSDAPLLTLGVAVCLRMRLFDDIEVSTPYPLASFNGITDWQWSMDDDFNRNTACTLVADAGGVSVHSVTDTVNGETMNFTEFVIQISNMNTEKLAAWLGSEGTKSGLTGELVGYDNGGHAVFVLQIENFSVRNRVAGLGDPTALDQEIVTRTQAEQMIQTAVSASASTKQDKLNSGNAGTGISISSAGVISTDNVPQSAVTGLESALSGKQNILSTGFWIEIDDDWISVERYHTIHGPYSSGSVTLQAGEAYKILATNSAITLNKENTPNNTWGIEGHAEIFVANAGYIHTGSNVVLADALVPDSVNNCTVRFHDGYAIISVEDHIAGHVVTVNAPSGTNTLNYWLGLANTSEASTQYISVDASLNGQILNLNSAVTNGEKHVVGNGYTETIVSGGINCTSKTTFSNLGMNGVVVSSGTLTMGDVYIPNGATVSVSGGGLAVEKVNGNGGVIDLGGTEIRPSASTRMSASGCTFMSGYHNPRGGAFEFFNAAGSFYNCTFTQNSAQYYGGAVHVELYQGTFASCYMSSCEIMLCSAYYAGALSVTNGSTFAVLESCYIHDNGGIYALQVREGADMHLSGCRVYNNTGTDVGVEKGNILVSGGTIGTIALVSSTDSATIEGAARINSVGGSGSVTISSGASINLTSSINPGGGVTFEQGGATIIPGGSSAIAYTLGGLTVPKIGNTNVIGLSSTYAYVSSNTSAVASNAIFSGGYASNVNGGAVVMGASASFSAFDCVFDKNSGYNAGGMIAPGEGCTLVLSGCTVTDNFAYNGGGVFLFSGASGEFVSCTMSGNKGYTAGALHVNAGASVSLSGCTITGNIASSAFGGGLNAYGNANISACTISGNSQGDIRIASNTVLIKDSTVGLIATSGGTVTFEGTNTLASAGGGTGTVIISGGASITLTSSIAPGGGITVLEGGCIVNGNDITASSYTLIDSTGTAS